MWLLQNLKITYVAHILFLLGVAVVGPHEAISFVRCCMCVYLAYYFFESPN